MGGRIQKPKRQKYLFYSYEIYFYIKFQIFVFVYLVKFTKGPLATNMMKKLNTIKSYTKQTLLITQVKLKKVYE